MAGYSRPEQHGASRALSGKAGRHKTLWVAKTLLIFEIDTLHCDPDVGEGIAAACYS